MQEQNIEKIIEERLNELPEVISNEISNGDWEQVVRQIIEREGLLIDQGLEVEKSTLMMILGLENPKEYTKNIKKRAKLSNEQAVNIAYEVDEKILQKIKRKVIEEAEKEAEMQDNPLKDIIGPKKEIDKIIPDVDLNTGEEPNTDEDERNKLINELEADIEITEHDDEDILEEINEQEDDWIEEVENLPTQEPIKENQIPYREEVSPNPRVIETDFSNQVDNLPGLEPLRTLQTDSENKDDIISSKLGGSQVKKAEDKYVSDKKQSGPDPYRESID